MIGKPQLSSVTLINLLNQDRHPIKAHCMCSGPLLGVGPPGHAGNKGTGPSLVARACSRHALLCFSLWRDPQHFFDGGQALRDLFRTRQAQAAHAIPGGLAADGRQVAVGADQGLETSAQ